MTTAGMTSRGITTFNVARRFCGPRDSANGGYICGLIARLVASPVTVRLLQPPPLDSPLTIAERDGLFEVFDGDDVIAQARPGEVGDLVLPPPPSFEQAVDASRRYAGFAAHPAPACFVCGPERAAGDALCIFPGVVQADSLKASRVVAAPWIPDASLDVGDGTVALEFVWAALDCPGFVAAADDMRSMLLGELTAQLDRRIPVGEPCTVIGWAIDTAGRKHRAGTAVFDTQGQLLARARAVWIEPRAAAGM